MHLDRCRITPYSHITMRCTLNTAAFLAIGFFTIPTAQAQNFLPASSRSVPRETSLKQIPRSWKISLAPLVASQALDVASSYGMRELNPVLAGPDGRFGARAATVKLGVTGALVGIEYLIVKAHPGAARVFTKINWSWAVLTTGFAAHNYAIK